MHHPAELRILFPTSFSDACFQTGRAIAQLADSCRVHLTIAHVADKGAGSIGLRRELDSFLAEADHYDHCRRIVVEGDSPTNAIAGICAKDRYDLIMAPASDRLRVHSLFTSSFRAKLLKACGVPVWTAGGCLERANFKNGIRNVACLVDFDHQSRTYLPLVAAFASRFGAKLRLLHIVPSVDEGTLTHSLTSNAPLMPGVAMERIRETFAGRVCPEIDVAVGTVSSELRRMLERCDADILFAGPGQVLGSSWLGRLGRYFDRLPCPVVCVDGAAASFDRWSFQDVAITSPARDIVISGEYRAAS